MQIVKPENAAFNKVFIISMPHKANGFQCMDVIIGDVGGSDISDIFGPLDDEEEFVRGEVIWDWAHLLKAAGIFPSNSQARKNGWNKPIDEGFSEVWFKKARKVIFVFKKAGEKE